MNNSASLQNADCLVRTKFISHLSELCFFLPSGCAAPAGGGEGWWGNPKTYFTAALRDDVLIIIMSLFSSLVSG